jgi:hypothetical protein
MSGIAGEGMFGTIESNGCISDKPEEFTSSAVELYTNEALWKDKQNIGFQILNERFSKDENYKKLDLKIEEAIQQLHAKRLNNFTGQMLWHHSLLSTRYMSKWIEEKNQKTSNYEG